MAVHDVAVEVTGSGPGLLLIPGIGATGNIFGPQVGALSRFFTVIRPDLRGSGRSATTGTISTATLVEDLVAVIDQHGGGAAVDVVGWSYGSVLAQHLAVGHPGLVRSLALLGPLGAPPEQGRAGLRQRATTAREQGMVSIADATVGVATSASTRTNRPEVAAFVRELVMRQDPEGYAQICEATAASEPAEVEHIDCPTLLITGDEDLTGPPPVARALADRIKGSHLEVLSRCAHWLTLERPVEVTDLLLNFYFGPAAH
ncbi:alpha/beta hydrolase [Pseudonocardia sp.]|jgi:3-oxoadipate enol-lactonase|uniref:alpha/beta fold hydrolase n=1 Tax=Pseudonocardia sp. TaxID=60912 RepID=UPI0026340F59|nr:alpha/beta hydrolase [Pseudonocardia sp.]MCW2719232.1 alpha/beta hydrolase [Pseudonocardia sp.]